jgi:hypothetical protein
MRARGGNSGNYRSIARPAAEGAVEELASHHVQVTTRADQPGLKEHCQKRDGHRCVVTGSWDLDHRREGELFGPLQAANIIPFALGSFQTI